MMIMICADKKIIINHNNQCYQCSIFFTTIVIYGKTKTINNMKKQKLFLHFPAILIIAFLIASCSGSGKDNNAKLKNDSLDSTKIAADSIKKIEDAKPKFLIIQGTNVNLRVAPNLDAVRIRQFKTGDTCDVIEKGNRDTVNDVIDYWYKVTRKSKEGWVFGALTSLKQSAESEKQNKSKTFNLIKKQK